MHQNRKLTKGQFQDRVAHIVSSARIQKLTHAQLHGSYLSGIWAEVNSVTASGKARYTNTMRGFVDGLFTALSHQLWAEVEFVYRDDDGKLYSTERGSIYPYWQDALGDSAGALVSQMAGGHVWRGTDKTFSSFSKGI